MCLGAEATAFFGRVDAADLELELGRIAARVIKEQVGGVATTAR